MRVVGAHNSTNKGKLIFDNCQWGLTESLFLGINRLVRGADRGLLFGADEGCSSGVWVVSGYGSELQQVQVPDAGASRAGRRL
jgi:hypothetical protein